MELEKTRCTVKFSRSEWGVIEDFLVFFTQEEFYDLDWSEIVRNIEIKMSGDGVTPDFDIEIKED